MIGSIPVLTVAAFVATGILAFISPASEQPGNEKKSAVIPLKGEKPHEITADHSKFKVLQQDFADGPAVTKACLSCHTEAAKQLMKTSHWTWMSSHRITDEKGQVKNMMLGKAKHVVNNFCIALVSNEPRCTSCHAGYGWKDSTFDFTDQNKVDCLVCHANTKIYKKYPAGAGHPVYKKDAPPGQGLAAQDWQQEV